MASLEELMYELRRIEQHRAELTDKRIKSIYRTLAKDLNGFIANEYTKYSDKDGKLFLSYLDSKNKRAKFLEEVVKNVDGISPQVKSELLDLVDKTYEKSYKGIVSAVKNAEDTKELLSGTKTLVRPEVLKTAIENNIEKLTLSSVMEKHRAEIIADIQQTLTVSLMNGDRYETMAKRIQERLGVSYSKASNIARTESHRNIESGMMDGAKETAKTLEGSDLIYAATWRTMRDERVRPQVRRKTKKGWVTTLSGNGANHMKMDGVTIKVGEQFQLEPGVYAECPGKSGTARNDCNCRCYLSYKLMTVEEFAKATGNKEEEIRRKYGIENISATTQKSHYNTSVEKEPNITELLKAEVEKTGAKLGGLEYRLKTERSYNEKIGKEVLETQCKINKLGIKYTVKADDVSEYMYDVVRYTCLSDKANFVDNYNDVIKNMQNKGYSLVRVKNTFKPNANYKGVNVIMQDAGGYKFELQFHTLQSFELKNGILHELYEKERRVSTTAIEKNKIREQMKKISDSIDIPIGIDKIESFNNLPDIVEEIKKKLL